MKTLDVKIDPFLIALSTAFSFTDGFCLFVRANREPKRSISMPMALNPLLSF